MNIQAYGLFTLSSHSNASESHSTDLLILSILHGSYEPLIMSSHDLHTSLLRPPIMHILRAAGFHATRPAAVDTLVDLAARYLMLLATKTASYSVSNRNIVAPTITDVRMALQDVGALWPSISTMEEQVIGEEDLRGVTGFIEWMRGEVNQEIRRVAGLSRSSDEVAALEGQTSEDFLTGLYSFSTHRIPSI